MANHRTTRAVAREELKRAHQGIDAVWVHVERVMRSHHSKGYPEFDQALEAIANGLQMTQQVIKGLRDRL